MGELPTNLKVTSACHSLSFLLICQIVQASPCSGRGRGCVWKSRSPPRLDTEAASPQLPALCTHGAELGAELEELQQGQAQGQGPLSCSVPSQQVPESRNCLTPPSIIHLGKNTKANHSTQDLDALKILPAECRGTAANGNLLSVTCVLTGILLDKASPEMLGMVLVTLCR